MKPEDTRNKSYQLLGKLLNSYTQLEYQLTWGILRVYGLQWAEGTILTAHIPFAGKCHSLRTATEYFSRSIMTDEWRREADLVLSEASKVVRRRNTVAHTYSDATTEGDILFTKVSAFGEFSEKETIVTAAEVDSEFEAVTDLAHDIAQIVSELVRGEGRSPPPREPNGRLNPLTPLYLEDTPHHSAGIANPTPSPS